jgi:hypothetical protein
MLRSLLPVAIWCAVLSLPQWDQRAEAQQH